MHSHLQCHPIQTASQSLPLYESSYTEPLLKPLMSTLTRWGLYPTEATDMKELLQAPNPTSEEPQALQALKGFGVLGIAL